VLALKFGILAIYVNAGFDKLNLPNWLKFVLGPILQNSISDENFG
jgi:hypothetical protein